MSQVLTDGNDAVVANQNVVYALDGNDRVITLLGSPELYGGKGNDFLGNQGNFVLYADGGANADVVHGGPTNDSLYGGEGSDLLVGGDFDYPTAFSTGTIVPFNNEGDSADILDGGPGKDSLWGF